MKKYDKQASYNMTLMLIHYKKVLQYHILLIIVLITLR